MAIKNKRRVLGISRLNYGDEIIQSLLSNEYLYQIKIQSNKLSQSEPACKVTLITQRATEAQLKIL